MTTPSISENPRPAAWLIGSAEPGCNGVGDQIRHVTNALRSGGDGEPSTLALRDEHVTQVCATENSLRLPDTLPLSKCIATAAEFLDRRRPGVLVWNFVPQMYTPRGIIPRAVVEAYAELRRGRRLVLFMHELWCGTGREDTVRNWLTGLVQRPGVLRWIEVHQPDRLLTSNAAYAAVLRHHGFEAIVVPLCSNIPRQAGFDRSQWPDALAGAGFAGAPRADWIVAGVFGAIHPIWKPEAALLELAARAHERGKKLAVVWFGRGSPAAEQSWDRVVKALTPRVRFARLGALPDRAASGVLESCDLGLPTVQLNLIGKSSAAAAFTEHGVPLLVVSDEWWPRFPGFERAAPDDSIVLWRPGTKIDWDNFLASRPEPGRLMAACLDAWRRALAVSGSRRSDEVADALPVADSRPATSIGAGPRLTEPQTSRD